MSDGPRIPLLIAHSLAAEVVELLRPYCQRIEIAGSVRRAKVDCGDIEVVCVPHACTDLLGETYYPTEEIRAALSKCYPFLMGGSMLQKYDLGPCHLEVYITTPAKWGVIFTLRTGPSDYSHRLVTARNKNGLLPSYMKVEDGRIVLKASGEQLETPEEKDVFRVAGIPWIEPEKRK